MWCTLYQSMHGEDQTVMPLLQRTTKNVHCLQQPPCYLCIFKTVGVYHDSFN